MCVCEKVRVGWLIQLGLSINSVFWCGKQLEALLTVWGGIINQAPIMANDSSAFQSPGDWGQTRDGLWLLTGEKVWK